MERVVEGIERKRDGSERDREDLQIDDWSDEQK
jgi:hypothetical protein